MSERLCPHCVAFVDEYHFLVKYKLYYHGQEKSQMKYLDIFDWESSDMFKLIHTSVDPPLL